MKNILEEGSAASTVQRYFYEWKYKRLQNTGYTQKQEGKIRVCQRKSKRACRVQKEKTIFGEMKPR